MIKISNEDNSILQMYFINQDEWDGSMKILTISMNLNQLHPDQ